MNRNAQYILLITISTFLFLGLIVLSLYYFSIEIYFNSLQWGILFLLIATCVIFFKKINNVSNLSIQSLFIFTVFLFLGGRFLSVFFVNADVDIFKLDFFVTYKLSHFDSTQLFLLVIIGIVFSETGQYIAIYNKRKVRVPIHHKSLISSTPQILSLLLILMAIIVLYILAIKWVAVIQYGYLGLYKFQANVNYSSRLDASLLTLFLLSFAVIFANGSSIQKKLSLIIYSIYSFNILLMGARGEFVVFLLLILWIYGDFGRKSISYVKAVIIALILFMFLNQLLLLSGMRSSVTSDSNLFLSIHKFLYDQGITLMIFDASMKQPDYPTLSYFQTLLPAASKISSLFTDTPGHYIHFSHYLAYALNEDFYRSGNGLGWSIFADLHLLSGRHVAVYALFFLIFGWIITKIESIAKTSNFLVGLIILLANGTFFIARSSLNIILPIIIYYSLFSILLTILIFILNKINNSQKLI